LWLIKLIKPNKKINWLILSHAFNMDGRAASQTITDKIPYLINAGIYLHVISAITGIKDHRFPHQQLIAWGPSAFRFDFRHWLASRYGRGIIYRLLTSITSITLAPLIAIERILIGYSSQWSWAFSAYYAALKLIRAGKIEVIYSTGGAWSAHLAGLWLKRKTKLPWIVEIHDPLVIRENEKDNGEKPPKGADNRKRYWLEKQICNYADIVWWFSEGALSYAEKRNPCLNKKSSTKGFVIVPGANPPQSAGKILNEHYYDSKLKIFHFGSLSKDRSMKPIIDQLPIFFKNHPDAKSEIEFHIYGAKLDKVSLKFINHNKVQLNFVEHGRLEHDSISGMSGRQKIAEIMNKADILLLLHGKGTWCSEYIPSKIYEYIWFGRPIWGVVSNNAQLKKIIEERNGIVSDLDDEITVYTALEKIWINWKKKELHKTEVKPISTEAAVEKIIMEVNKININTNEQRF